MTDSKKIGERMMDIAGIAFFVLMSCSTSFFAFLIFSRFPLMDPEPALFIYSILIGMFTISLVGIYKLLKRMSKRK